MLLNRAMPSITSFSLYFDKVNDSGTFSEGDTISGKVSLELIKWTQILSLYVKAKGDADTAFKAEVSDGDTGTYETTVTGHERLFKVKEYFISTKVKLSPGSYSFPFNLRIPSKCMPSCFHCANGSIVYTLEAKLCRRILSDRTVHQTFEFRSKCAPNCVQMCRQMVSMTEREIWSDESGTVQMEVRLQKNFFSPGEIVPITTKVIKFPNRIMTLEFVLSCLERYCAVGSYIRITRQIMSIDRVQSEEELTNCQILMPQTLPSVHNCKIISVEYKLEGQLRFHRNISKLLGKALPVMVVHTDTPSGAHSKPTESKGAGTAEALLDRATGLLYTDV